MAAKKAKRKGSSGARTGREQGTLEKASRKKAAHKGTAGKKTSRKKAARKTAARKKWSSGVQSDALDLDQGVFTWKDPARIAGSLARSAERSTRRKGTPLQSAMSMLNYYINRAGHTLDARQRRVLEDAKGELRKRFGRDRGVP